MFPEPRIDLKKDQEKSLFLRLCKFLDAHRLILMIPQLQIKFRTFLNQSKTLAAGYSLNKTKQKQTTNKQCTGWEKRTTQVWLGCEINIAIYWQWTAASNQETDNAKKYIFSFFHLRRRRRRSWEASSHHWKKTSQGRHCLKLTQPHS